MTLDDIRKYTNTLADKHRSGKRLTEQQFNLYLDAVNLEMFTDYYGIIKQQAMERGLPLNKMLYESDTLREFKVMDHTVGLTSGVGSLPADYLYYLAVSSLSTPSRFIEIVSDFDFATVRDNMFQLNASIAPIGVIYSDSIRVVPTTFGSLKLSYLKKPATPYYDYCVEADTRQVIYIPPGYVVEDNRLKTSIGGTILVYGVEHLSGEDPYTGVSVELEWDEESHPEFANRILTKMGISMKDAPLYEIGKTEQQ